MKNRLLVWSITASLAGFLFGFDTIVISGAEEDFQRLNQQVETDHAFWDHAPSMQLIYCLENSDNATDILLVDGFEAVHRLRRKRPDHFETLYRLNGRWGAVDDDHNSAE